MPTTTRQGARLGNLLLQPPLHVVVQPQGDTGYKATLEPAPMCDDEWGYGATPAQAIADLAAGVSELYDKLLATDDDKLGESLLTYKRTLLAYASKVQSGDMS